MPSIKQLRSASFHTQEGRCFYCDQPMWLADPTAFAARWGLSARQAARHQATAEHLRPRNDGGRDVAANIAAACSYCNHHRHTRGRATPALSPAKYRAHVQRRRARRAWHGFWPLIDVAEGGTSPRPPLSVHI